MPDERVSYCLVPRCGRLVHPLKFVCPEHAESFDVDAYVLGDAAFVLDQVAHLVTINYPESDARDEIFSHIDRVLEQIEAAGTLRLVERGALRTTRRTRKAASEGGRRARDTSWYAEAVEAVTRYHAEHSAVSWSKVCERVGAKLKPPRSRRAVETAAAPVDWRKKKSGS